MSTSTRWIGLQDRRLEIKIGHNISSVLCSMARHIIRLFAILPFDTGNLKPQACQVMNSEGVELHTQLTETTKSRSAETGWWGKSQSSSYLMRKAENNDEYCAQQPSPTLLVRRAVA